MAYDGPKTKYSFPVTNAALAFPVKGPKGKQGILYDYGVQGVSTAFVGATTPHIMIGTAADDDAFGDEFDLGALAVTEAKSLRSTYTPDQAAFDALMVQRIIPADTTVQLKWTPATTSGVGSAFCEIIWGT